MGLKTRAGIVVAVALAALAGAVKPAHAFEIAVQDDRTLLAGTSYSRGHALDQIRAIGATVVRVNVIYADWVRLRPRAYHSPLDPRPSNGLRGPSPLPGHPAS